MTHALRTTRPAKGGGIFGSIVRGAGRLFKLGKNIIGGAFGTVFGRPTPTPLPPARTGASPVAPPPATRAGGFLGGIDFKNPLVLGGIALAAFLLMRRRK